MSKGVGQKKQGTFWGGSTMKLAGSQGSVKEAKAPHHSKWMHFL